MANIAGIFSFGNFLAEKGALFTNPPYFGWIGLAVIIIYIVLRVSGKLDTPKIGNKSSNSSNSNETFYEVK